MAVGKVRAVESTSELAWFRGEIWRSLVHPVDFARDLAREHYGLAGVLVALVSGIGLSIGIDLLVLASKGIGPGSYVARMVIDAFLLGVRLAVTAAIVAWIASGAVRLMRQRSGSLDQLFTAVTFAFAPLLLVPVAGLVVTAAPADLTLTLAAGLVFVLALRVLIGVGLNIRAILPPAVAAVAFMLVTVLGALVLGDQVSRMRFLSYALAPQLLPEFSTTPATGERFDGLGFDIALPKGWTVATGGIPGEAGRFESSTATIRILRARGAALSTADSYADSIGGNERVGLHDSFMRRDVVRLNGLVVVDDRYGGDYEGRHVVWRQITAVPGGQGLAFVYRQVQPADDVAALAEAATIAATWHITAAGR